METQQLELFTNRQTKTVRIAVEVIGTAAKVLPHAKGPYAFNKDYAGESLSLNGDFSSDFTTACSKWAEFENTPEIMQYYYGPRLRRIFSDHIRHIIDMGSIKGKVIKSFEQGPDVLTVHIRGGDIMNPHSAHPGFVQAPFSYLEKILSGSEYRKVIVCTEHQGPMNPIVQKLIRYCENNLISIDVEPRSMKNDIELILEAQNLAITGHTSFSRTLALCSHNLKKLYIPRLHQLSTPDICQSALRGRIDMSLYTYRFDDYFEDGSAWKASTSQKRKMLNHPLAKVRLES